MTLTFRLLLFSLSSSSCRQRGIPGAPPSDRTAVHDLLPKYNLPPGILPNSVKSYELNHGGRFVVKLNAPCNVKLFDMVQYETKITGVLSQGRIEKLQGVSSRRLSVSIRVSTIKVDLPPTDVIYFDVGLISKKLPVDQFKAIPSC